MNAEQIIFYIIAACILAAGLLSVTSRKIFRSAIWLLFSLIGVAGLYFWMDMQFIAAVQIVIYVGGIVVLIIFSIFLTQRSGDKMLKPPITRIIASALAVIIGFVLSYSLIYQNKFIDTNQPYSYDVSMIGTHMLSTGNDGFALPFEVVSILLLAAMIGCIVIAMRGPKIISGLKNCDTNQLTGENLPTTNDLTPETVQTIDQ